MRTYSLKPGLSVQVLSCNICLEVFGNYTVSAHAYVKLTLQSKGYCVWISKNNSNLQYLVIRHYKRRLNLWNSQIISLWMKNIEIFEMPFSICLSKLFCNSFKTASLSLSIFDKMVNIEEKSRTLNFQRFHFLMEFPLEVTSQHNFFETKDPTLWLYFLYVKRQFISCTWSGRTSQLFCDLIPKVSIAM